MPRACTRSSAARTLDGRTLIAFGGAAPLHAARLADKLGIGRVVIPSGAGVGSAVGFLRAPVAYEVVRSRYVRLDDKFDPECVNALLAEMRAEAEAVVRRGAPDAALCGDPRRRHALHRPGPRDRRRPAGRPLRRNDRSRCCVQRFERDYPRAFGRTIPGIEVEIMNWTLRLAAARRGAAAMSAVDRHRGPRSRGETALSSTPTSWRVQDVSGLSTATICARRAMAGPAVITEDETTTVVPAGFTRTHRCARLHRAREGAAHERQRSSLRHPDAAHVGPADRGRRGAGADAGAHRLLTSTREAGDLSAGVFDLERRACWRRRSPARPATSIRWRARCAISSRSSRPSTMARRRRLRHQRSLEGHRPPARLHVRDADFPRRQAGRAVRVHRATSSTSAARGMTPDGRQVYEEGIYIPLMRFARAGVDERDAGRHHPRQRARAGAGEGDLYSLAACNEIGCRRLVAMMDEFGIDDLGALGRHHPREVERGHRSRRSARCQPGTYKYTMTIDGYDKPIELAAHDDDRRDRHRRRLRRHVRHVALRHQRAVLLHGGLFVVRREAASSAPKVPNNEGSLSVIRDCGAGRLRSSTPSGRRRSRRATSRSAAARRHVRLPAPGAAGQCAGGRRVVPVESVRARRARPRGRRPCRDSATQSRST